MRVKYREAFQFRDDPSWMMEHEGRVICAFGAAKLWDGVYEVWFNLVSPEKTVRMLRQLKKHFEENIKKYAVSRLQSVVRCEFKAAKRFVESFGFEMEGKLSKYNPDGSDAFMYAKTYETPCGEF